MLREVVSRIEDKLILHRSEKIKILRKIFSVYAVIFVVWGVYRLLLRFPLSIEEVLIKPTIFLLPVFFVFRQEGKKFRDALSSLGYRRDNIFFTLYFGLTLGVVYVVASVLGSSVFSGVNVFENISYLEGQITPIILVSLATAVWEQTVFSGFVLQRLEKYLANEWLSVLLTALLFTLLHVPILWLDSTNQPLFIVIQLLLLTMIGFGNAVLMLRARNIFAPILSHTFWILSIQLIV
jgi:membrane protease YdiL (CAAX protease family)